MNKDEARKTIGQVIRIKRRRKNISQEKLAEAIGITKSSISRYEKGLMEIPASILPLICEECKFPFSDFFKTETIEDTFKFFESTIRERSTDKKKYLYIDDQKEMHKFLLSEEGATVYEQINLTRQVADKFNLSETDYVIRELGHQTYFDMISTIKDSRTIKDTSKERLMAYLNALRVSSSK